MKILWLSHLVPYPPKAGVLQRSYNLLKESTRYHEVDLLSFIQDDFFNQIFKDPEQGKREAGEHLSGICKRIKFIPIESENGPFGKYTLALKSLFTHYPYTLNWLHSRAYANTLQEWMATRDYDLIHFDTISLAPYQQYTQHIPCNMNHHNIESHLLIRRAEQESNPIKKFYFNQEGVRLEKYEREHCKHFSANITCSDTDSERLKQIDSGLYTKAIPNGVDLEYFQSSDTFSSDKSITFIGTLNWEPNRKAVIYIAEKIWPLLKQQHPDIQCHIIGTHPPQEVLSLAKKDVQFKVHGFVTDVRDYLIQGTIFVCPIKDGGGTKLKLLDAFAMKTAVVADPIACEGIEVTDKKDVLLATTPEEYTHQITSLIEDNKKRQELGENARQLIEEKYSYVSIGRALSDLFIDIAQTE